MKKNVLLYLFSCFTLLGVSQPNQCLPSFGGVSSSNEPPGCLMCGWFNFGSTEGFDSTAVSDANFPCGTIENNQFFSFIPNDSGAISCQISASFCSQEQGIEFIIYDELLNPVSDCYTIQNDANPISQTIDGLMPGALYHVMIDGISGDTCDFDFRILSGQARQQVDTALLNQTPIIYNQSGRSVICLEEEICFTTEKLPGMTHFFWGADSLQTTNDSERRGGTPIDSFLCLKFKTPGTKFIEYYSVYGCQFGRGEFITFTVRAPGDTLSALICPGETYSIHNMELDSADNYKIVFENASPEGCDSIVLLDLKMPDTSAVEVFCFADTFLNVLTIGWDERVLAEEFDVFIDGNLVSTQSFQGYIYNVTNPGEEIEISIHPKGAHGCEYKIGTTRCIVPNFSSAKEITHGSKIQVFPNPSENKFEVRSPEKIDKIEVFDFTGKQVKETFKNEVLLENQPSGIYFLKIYSNENVVLKKVMKL